MRKVVIVLLAAALHLQSADDASSGLDPDRLARIPARMKEFVQEGKSAGAVMLMARHDGIAFLEAVGYQDLGTQKAYADRYHLPDPLDDQVGDCGRHHDSVRRGATDAQ